MVNNSLLERKVGHQGVTFGEIVLGIWRQLRVRRKWQISILVLVMISSGVAEIFSLASVLPFLTVVTEPNRLWELHYVKNVSQTLGFKSPNDLLLPFTLLFGLSVLISGVIRLANLWLNGRLAAAVGTDLSYEAYRKTLFQPYQVHISRNSSSFITTMTTHIDHTMLVVNAILQLLTSVFVIICLLLGMLMINWEITMIGFIIFTIAYSLVAVKTKSTLASNSSLVAKSSKEQVKILQEGLGAIRDILLDGSQHSFLNRFKKLDVSMRIAVAESRFFGGFPRYAIEAIALIFIACTTLLLNLRVGSSSIVLPLIGTLALGAQRMLPAIQQGYQSFSRIKSFGSSVMNVISLVEQEISITEFSPRKEPIKMYDKIRLENVKFQYHNNDYVVLKGINLTINRGDKIGIIGSTGSGKSTLIDILMCLLEPTEGSFQIDGRNLYESKFSGLISAWRKNVGHVPQSIYLADTSIAENIAFGIKPSDINYSRIKDATKKAQLDDFIEKLPNGYNTIVGERGISLSGGQRQRIGIARALYKNTSLLILDEATSSLDNECENAVINSIEKLSQDYTVITIAHRLSTVMRCDKIIELENGCIKRILKGSDIKDKIIKGIEEV